MTGIDAAGEDLLATALWFLVADAGHLGCDAWTFEERDRLLRCACGTVLYELHETGRRRTRAPRPGVEGGDG